MALTPQQVADLTYYLGYSVGPVYTELAGGIARLGSAPAPTVTQFDDLITQLKAIDVRLTNALKLLSVGSAGSFTGTGSLQISALRSEGRRLVNRVSALASCPALQDVFSAAPIRVDNRITYG